MERVFRHEQDHFKTLKQLRRPGENLRLNVLLQYKPNSHHPDRKPGKHICYGRRSWNSNIILSVLLSVEIMPPPGKMRKPDIKMVVLGDMNVGKTSLLHRYTERNFKDTLSTIGGAFFLKQWGPYNISIWDTAGREQFHGLGSMYCRGAAAIILTYDVTNWQSFVELEDRFLSLTDSANSDSLFAIVGNKADLTDPQAQVMVPEEVRAEEGSVLPLPSCLTPLDFPLHKQVSQDDAIALYKRIIRFKALEGISPPAEKMCFETSAKTGFNVDFMFETVFDLVLPFIIQKRSQSESPKLCLEDYNEEGRKSKGNCCT